MHTFCGDFNDRDKTQLCSETTWKAILMKGNKTDWCVVHSGMPSALRSKPTIMAWEALTGSRNLQWDEFLQEIGGKICVFPYDILTTYL